MLLVMGSAIRDASGGQQWRHTSPKADHTQLAAQGGTFPLVSNLSAQVEVLSSAVSEHMCRGATNLLSKEAAFVESLPFRLMVNATIFFNAAQMGLALDFKGEGWDDAWQLCEHFFTAFFLLEMLFKLYALKMKAYFADRWNQFDFSMVWIAVFSAWIMPAAGGSANVASNVSMLRLLRLLRLLRMAKLLKIFPEFMIVINSIVGAFKSLFWVFLLGLFILYVFAVASVQLMGGSDAGYPDYSESSVDIDEAALGDFNNYLYFGSMGRSLLSLFSLMLLSEMDVIFRAVYEVQPYMILMFMAMLCISTFGLLNVLVGMVVDNVLQAVKGIEEEKQELHRAQQMALVKELAKLVFDHMDCDQDGLVSVVEIQQLIQIVDSISLPHGFALEDLHKMLDSDGSGQLTKKEFLDGMFRLVFNTDFQRDCMVQLALGQIKAEQFKMHHALRKEIHTCVDSLVSEIRLGQSQFGPLDGGPAPNRCKSMSASSSLSSTTVSGLHNRSSSKSDGEPKLNSAFAVNGSHKADTSTDYMGVQPQLPAAQSKDCPRAGAADPGTAVVRLSAAGQGLPPENPDNTLRYEDNGLEEQEAAVKFAKLVPDRISSSHHEAKSKEDLEQKANPVRTAMMKVGSVRQTKPPQLTSDESNSDGGVGLTFWSRGKDSIKEDI